MLQLLPFCLSRFPSALLCETELRAAHAPDNQADPSHPHIPKMDLISRLFQLDGIIATESSSTPVVESSKFIVPCLLSRHFSIKQSILGLLALLATAEEPLVSFGVLACSHRICS